eukprot:376719_1
MNFTNKTIAIHLVTMVASVGFKFTVFSSGKFNDKMYKIIKKIPNNHNMKYRTSFNITFGTDMSSSSLAIGLFSKDVLLVTLTFCNSICAFSSFCKKLIILLFLSMMYTYVILPNEIILRISIKSNQLFHCRSGTMSEKTLIQPKQLHNNSQQMDKKK